LSGLGAGEEQIALDAALRKAGINAGQSSTFQNLLSAVNTFI
jgi:hypothetical protein